MGSGFFPVLAGVMTRQPALVQYGLQQAQQPGAQKAWTEALPLLLGGGGQQGAPTPALLSPPGPPVGTGGPAVVSPAGGMRGAAGGAPGNYGDLVNRIVGIESGGNPNARSTTSSATGPAQFINSTWLSTVKKHRPDLAQGKTDADLLALRTDPALAREMTGAYAQDNAAFLANRGLPTGPTEVYAAHNLGPAGAAKVLSASPETPLSTLLGDEVMRANPHMRDMTAGSYRKWVAGKIGGGGAPAVAGAPSTPQQSIAGLNLTPEQTQTWARMLSNPATSDFAQKFLASRLGGTDKPTDDIREYEYARRQGYQGSFPDFIASRRQTMNIQTGERKMAQLAATEYGEAQAASREAAKRAPVYQRMRTAMTEFQPGASADWRLWVQRWGKDLGLNIGANASEGEVFKAMQRRLELLSTPKGQGQITENERALIREMIPNLTQSPQAVVGVLDMLERLDKYDRDVARIYRENAKKNNGSVNRVEVDEAVAALGSPLTPEQNVIISGGPTPPARPGAPGQPAPATPAVTPEAGRANWARLTPQKQQEAIERLAKNPTEAEKKTFDAAFGEGMADEVLRRLEEAESQENEQVLQRAKQMLRTGTPRRTVEEALKRRGIDPRRLDEP